MFIFSLIIAFITAQLEIHTEGEHGWAKNLPTWRKKNKLTRLLWGEQEFTGYHLWLLLLNLIYLQLPFFVGYPWSLALEVQILAVFCLGVIVEDFLWFALNPHYGVKKFNKVSIHWHKEWRFGIPLLYIKMLSSALILILLSTRL